jgi:outer membrane receptor protein involved in Fe transport
VEVETQITPFTGFLIQVGFAYLDSTFGDFVVSKQVRAGAPQGNKSGQSADFVYTGNRLIAAPKFSVSGVVDYEIPLSRWGSLVPQFSFSWKSRTYLDPSQSELISQPSHALLNARLAYRTPSGQIEVAFWIENFTDERYKIDVFDVSRELDMVTEVYGYPRSFGITASYNF